MAAMQSINGQNDMLLNYDVTAQGIRILRVRTGDSAVTLPDALLGKPIAALGDEAFAVGGGGARGRVVRVIAKGGDIGDNSALSDVTLPDTLQSVGAYAFYNCAALRTLRLSGRTRAWGTGALMNCKELHTLKLRLVDGDASLIKYFVCELANELDIALCYPDGGSARLIFPEYFESVDENVPARIFDYHIVGAGYPYRYCFTDGAPDLRRYDELWPGYLSMEYDPACADKLAFFRLRFPRALCARAQADYTAYVLSRAAEVLLWLLDAKDMRGLDFLLHLAPLPASALAQGAEQARRTGATEALAMLLEQQRASLPKGAAKSFAL